MNLQDFKNKLLQNPEFREEYLKKDLAFDIGLKITEARMIKNITQKQLAEKIGTKQTSISRVESGDYLPSLSFLEKIANALSIDLIVDLAVKNVDVSNEAGLKKVPSFIFVSHGSGSQHFQGNLKNHTETINERINEENVISAKQ